MAGRPGSDFAVDDRVLQGGQLWVDMILTPKRATVLGLLLYSIIWNEVDMVRWVESGQLYKLIKHRQ